jgi:hypothetical protein
MVHEAVVGEFVGVGVTLSDLFEDLDKALDGRVGGFVGVREFLGVEGKGEEEEKAPHEGIEHAEVSLGNDGGRDGW